MQKIFFFTLLFLTHFKAMTQDSLAGEYYLRGVMETGSGFKLNGDSTFQFFYSYGALDRMGEGKWHVSGGNVVFNSRQRPPLDFRLVSSKAGDPKFNIVRIVDRNANILRYMEVTFVGPGGEKVITASTDGVAKFPPGRIDSIGLIFRWCPDRISFFKITDPKMHDFEFAIEPWIAEVFFDNFMLTPTAEGFYGAHPLLNGNRFTYQKAK